MKRARQTGSKSKIFFSEEQGTLSLLVINEYSNQRQRVPLHKGNLFISSDETGSTFVSDRYNLFCIRDGLLTRSYRALRKMRDIKCFSGHALVTERNMAFCFDPDGTMKWHYMHSEVIVKATIEDEYVELIDKTGLSFRLLLKNGKLDKRRSSSTSWTTWDMGKEGWTEKLSVLIEDLSKRNRKTSRK